MDASIRVNSSDKQIEVNDDGDYITLRLGDAAFTNGLTQLIKEAQRCATELDAMPSGDTPEETAKFTEASVEACNQIVEHIDGLFGADTCKKVFGDRTPDFAAFTEFFTQIAALVKKFEEERRMESEKRIAKYVSKYTVKHGNS